jgi:trans-aconitate methyltransferase
MIVCRKCAHAIEYIASCCPHCGWQAPQIDGFVAFAPELAHDGGGFHADAFERLYAQENRHFWFRVRNDVILTLLQQFTSHMQSFFEIGCGTGYVMTAVAQRFPHTKIFGGELFVNGLFFAAQRIPSAVFMQIDARFMPFDAEFTVIGMFDVLEHIAEDTQVLQSAYNALQPGGFLICSVPQHQWLWSNLDDYSKHQRRYERGELEQKMHDAGFTVKRSTSFNSLLLPAMYVSRLLQRKRMPSPDGMGEFNIHPLVNRLFEWILRIELWFIKCGINFPIGGSRMIIVQK